jgi:hypothetical protein
MFQFFRNDGKYNTAAEAIVGKCFSRADNALSG